MEFKPKEIRGCNRGCDCQYTSKKALRARRTISRIYPASVNEDSVYFSDTVQILSTLIILAPVEVMYTKMYQGSGLKILYIMPNMNCIKAASKLLNPATVQSDVYFINTSAGQK